MTSRSFIGFNFENRPKIDRFMIVNLGLVLHSGSGLLLLLLLSTINVTALLVIVAFSFFYKKCVIRVCTYTLYIRRLIYLVFSYFEHEPYVVFIIL